MSESKHCIEEVQEIMLDNIDFMEVGSVAKAKLFAANARKWLLLNPLNAAGAGKSVTLNVPQVENMLAAAINFINVHGSNGGVRFLGANNYRG